MACGSLKLTGLARDCDANIGGVKKVWLAIYQDNMFTVSAGTDGDEVSAIATGSKWYEYNFRKGTASMTSTLNIDDANGINFCQTDLSLIFSRMETKKRTEMAALATGEVCAIVLDCNDHYWAMGVSEPVTSSAGAGQTGTARSDANNYTLTLTDYYKSYPLEIVAEAAKGITTGE